MKKSSGVPASLIVTIAAAIVAGGCNSNDSFGDGGRNVCLDAANNVVPDAQCKSGVRGAHWIRSGGFGSSGTSSSYGG